MKRLFILTCFASLSVVAVAGVLDETVSAVSDYRFRGVSQSNLQPSLANQIEFTGDDGFWLGNKLNSISKQEYPGIGLEADVYGGYTHQFDNGWKIYLGDYEYTYGGATKFNTNEVFAQLRVPYLTFKYYRSMSDYFAAANSVGNQYFSLDNYLPIEEITFISHVGYTKSPLNGASYADWRVGPAYTFYGIELALNYYWNSGLSLNQKKAYTADSHELYKNAFVLSIGKSW